MSWLPIHPLPMTTVFSTCLLANFAIEPEALRRKLPAHLEPDLHDGKAYVSIVIARMEKMRPAFLPRALGITYNQVVYRAVVRCGAERGVTFLRSDADSAPMVAAGNALTFFRFNSAEIAWSGEAASLHFSLRPNDGATAAIEATYDEVAGAHPAGRFPDMASAQAFLSELYVAFGAQRGDGRVEKVCIERTPWESLQVSDRASRYEAMTSGLLFTSEEARLDSVFLVRNLRYRWERLRLTGKIPNAVEPMSG